MKTIYNREYYEDLEPEDEETCVICGKQGDLIDGSWYEDSYAETEDGMPYIAGRGYLKDATETPSGWVCSKRCRSQEMYNRASRDGKFHLGAVRDAARVIYEQFDCAANIVDGEMGGYLGDGAVDSAKKFLEAIGEEDGEDGPDWCYQPSPAEKLERAMPRITRKLEMLIDEMAVEVRVRATHPASRAVTPEYQLTALGTHVATLGNILLKLKELED